MTAKTEAAPYTEVKDFPCVEGKNGILARIVAHSQSQFTGSLMSTYVLRYPRFIHEEFMTHRALSRNAASNRAIPVHKVAQAVKTNPAVPVFFGTNQPGMVANEPVEDQYEAAEVWKSLAREAATNSMRLAGRNWHKQIANRPMQTYQFIEVIVTATEWDNFFNLRLAPDAQPEFRELARCMDAVRKITSPVLLGQGEWHTPLYGAGYLQHPYTRAEYNTALQVSAARCARVTHLNHHHKPSGIEKDRELYRGLKDSRHSSPFEHQAKPMVKYRLQCASAMKELGMTHIDRDGFVWSNNFCGWIQHRAVLDI